MRHANDDNTDEHYELSGGLQDGKMVLTGDERRGGGRTVRIRVTLEPVGDKVRQTVELSRNAGASWRQVMDLTYAGSGE